MVFSIALYVGAYFLFPKFRIVLRPHKIVTTLMPMPETTVYKDHSLIFGKNNIRFSWKPSVIFSVPESLRKQVFSDKFFWFSILSTDSGAACIRGTRFRVRSWGPLLSFLSQMSRVIVRCAAVPRPLPRTWSAPRHRCCRRAACAVSGSAS